MTESYRRFPLSELQALKFIDRIGRDDSLRQRLAELGPNAKLKKVVSLAGENGFVFTEEQLRLAFAKEWKIRKLLIHAKRDQHKGARRKLGAKTYNDP